MSTAAIIQGSARCCLQATSERSIRWDSCCAVPAYVSRASASRSLNPCRHKRMRINRLPSTHFHLTTYLDVMRFTAPLRLRRLNTPYFCQILSSSMVDSRTCLAWMICSALSKVSSSLLTTVRLAPPASKICIA